MVLVSVSRGAVSAAGRRRRRRRGRGVSAVGGVYTGHMYKPMLGMYHIQGMGRRRRRMGGNRFTDFFTKTLRHGFEDAGNKIKDAFTKPVKLPSGVKNVLNTLRDTVNPAIAKVLPTVISKIPIPGANVISEGLNKASEGYLKLMPPQKGPFASGRRRMRRGRGFSEYGGRLRRRGRGSRAVGGRMRMRRRVMGGLLMERGRQRGGLYLPLPQMPVLPSLSKFLKRGKEIYDTVRPGVEMALDIAKLVKGKGRRMRRGRGVMCRTRLRGCGSVQGSGYRRIRLVRPRGRGLIPVGSGRRGQSAWISRVRQYSTSHGIPLKEAMLALKR